MEEINTALTLAGVGFGYVFFFLGCLILLLSLSSYIFSMFTDSEEDLREAASMAAIQHHKKHRS